ncbi:MAG TPA: hypothetical protein VEU95_08800, partial [Micropepsaceae bacterium]|nr:hypothetical protein [Micropepsaceae bacterium]
MFKFGSTCLAICALSAAGGALAADGAKPRVPIFAYTPNTGWVLDHAFGVDDLLPAPGGGPGPVTFDKAHPYVPNNFGPQSTYRVADLSNPILQEWLKPSMKKANDEVLAGKIPYRARERCWPVGVPGFDAYSLVEPFYFYERPQEIVVINQGGPEIRHIYMNVPHSKNVKPSWYGDSIGHYEGDSLWVDTVGLNDKTYVDGFLTPHTEKLHVVERFHLIDGGKTLEVNVHVEDPGAFTTPWDAVQRYRRVEPATAENALVVPNDG